MNIKQTLREEARKSILTQRQIAADAELDPGVLSRFLSGKAGLSIANAEKLLVYFRYDLKKRKGTK